MEGMFFPIVFRVSSIIRFVTSFVCSCILVFRGRLVVPICAPVQSEQGILLATLAVSSFEIGSFVGIKRCPWLLVLLDL